MADESQVGWITIDDRGIHYEVVEEPALTNDDLYDEDGELNRRDTDELDSCVGTFDEGDAMDHGAGGGDPDEGWDAGYHYFDPKHSDA